MIPLEIALDEPAAHFGKVVFDRGLRIRRGRLVTARRLINVGVSFSSHNSLRLTLLPSDLLDVRLKATDVEWRSCY
jgi:hypothetical protein